MRDTRKIARPRLLVPLGFGSATLGAVVLSLSTFQTQTQGPSGSSLGSGSVTFTFTWQPLFPVTAALLVLIMAIPAWSGYLRWKYHLSSLVAPALVALGMVWAIYWEMLAPSVGTIVLSSALWVFLGYALVFLGCALEIAGVVLTRLRRGDAIGDRSPGTASSPSALSRPR